MIRFGPAPAVYPLTPAALRSAAGVPVVAPVAPAKPPPIVFDPRETFAVVVKGKPIPQPRHRASARMIRNKKTGQLVPLPHMYLPKTDKVHRYKSDVANAVRAALPIGWKMDAPIAVACVFVYPRTAKHPRKGGRIPKNTLPDADNLTKAVFDACKEIAWNDDGQVAAQLAAKFYGAPHDDPHTVIVFDQRPGTILSGEWAARLMARVSNI